MTKLEKRKNIAGGIIMYSLMIITYIIASFSYLITIVRSYATAYTWCYFFEDLLLIFAVIVAFVVMLVRKRQSGFGVVSPMLVSVFSQICFLIALAIQNSGMYYRVHPNWTTYLTFLLIIPIVLVIVFFFIPNRVLQIISASSVGIALIVGLVRTTIEITTALRRSYFSGMYAVSVIFSLITMILLYSLIIVQIFTSFRKAGSAPAVNAYQASGYVPVQSAPQPVQNIVPVEVRTVPKEQILANFQALLDKGMITQEQFDEKKKELFGEDGQE